MKKFPGVQTGSFVLQPVATSKLPWLPGSSKLSLTLGIRYENKQQSTDDQPSLPETRTRNADAQW